MPTRGIPRIGALRDMSYGVRQFLLTDPGGNIIRIGQPLAATDGGGASDLAAREGARRGNPADVLEGRPADDGAGHRRRHGR